MQAIRLTSGRLYVLVALILLVAAAIVPSLGNRYLAVTLADIYMYAVLTVAWALFSGPTGYVSLANAAFFGIGVYSMAVIGFSMPLPVAIIGGGVLSIVLALVVGGLTLRLRGIYFTIFTFVLLQLVSGLLLWWEVNISHTVGRIIKPVDNTTVYYLILGVLILTLLVWFFIRRSRFGLALQCIGDCEEAASHIGINVTYQKIAFFALSAFFIGVAGAIMATRWTYIDPRIAFNPQYSFLPVLMASFGGMGMLAGPVFGAAFLTYLEEFLLTRVPNLYMLLFGLILVIVILFMPNGVAGLIQERRRASQEAKRATTTT